MVSFDFKDKSLLGLDSSGGIDILPQEADVAAALASNSAFPSRKLEIASDSLKSQGSKDITFGRNAADTAGKGQVTFSGNAGAGLVVNGDPNQIVAALSLAQPIASGLTFSADDTTSYAALSWNYGLQAGATGAMTLGGGVQAGGSASASRTGAFALIHRFPKTQGSRDVLQDLLDSWRIPNQLDSPDDLKPGTWMVSEVDGNLSLSLNATYGYDFNWLRRVEAGNLSGDIGLRLQAGISAAFGLTASGRYALVASRETADRKLRVRLYKQPVRGMSFALHAGATAQASQTVAPATLNELLRAVLNVQDQQILADVEKWLDPTKSLEQLLSADLVTEFETFLNEVTGLDIATQINQARAKVAAALKQWDTLDQRVASTLWSKIGDQQYVVAVRGFAQKVVDLSANNDAQLRQLLETEIEKQGFFQSPVGEWLESQAVDGLLELIDDNQQLARLKQVSQKTLSLLSEQELVQITSKLQDSLEKRFGLDKVETRIQGALTASDPTKIDAWLKDRLTAFLGKSPLIQDLDSIKKTIDAWQSRAADFYTKALKALTKQYSASLAVTYQKTTTGTALLDVEFDFSAGDLSQLVRQTLDGKFDRLLTETIPGVTLHQATLTHQIQRSRQVDLTLPSTFAEMKDVNQGLASVTAIEDDGRVLLYEGQGSDEVSFATAKTRRDSRLSVTAQLPVKVDGLRQFQDGTLSFSYSFQQATKQLQKDRASNLLQPYAELFLPDSAATFPTWLDQLDNDVEAREPQGAKILGNTLLSLEVNVPPAVGGAWLKAPAAGDPKYRTMSLLIQRRFKEVLSMSWFGPDVDRYGDPASDFLLVWAAIPPANSDSGLYWDHVDDDMVRTMVNQPDTDKNLQAFAKRANALLASIGRNDLAQKYADPDDYSRVARRNAFSTTGQARPQLHSLLLVESKLVNNAAEVGADIQNVLKLAPAQPQQAVAALAEYTTKLTDVFNQDVWSLYGKGAVRPLGTILFQEAARAFDPTVQVDDSALLRLTVVKKAVTPFPPANFPQNAPVSADQVLVDETLVNA